MNVCSATLVSCMAGQKQFEFIFVIYIIPYLCVVRDRLRESTFIAKKAMGGHSIDKKTIGKVLIMAVRDLEMG